MRVLTHLAPAAPLDGPGYTRPMSSITAYLGVARAPFLLLPVTLVASGAAAAAFDGALVFWPRALLAMAALVALHMAVNIFNEVSDLRTGIDLETERTPFSGGSGTLPSGAMSSRTATVFGASCAAFGLAVGLWFLYVIGLVFLPVMVAGALCVLIYTDVLARMGAGELAAGLGLGALPVIGAALVQNGHVGPAAIAASVPAFFMTFNLLLLNEFPDESADAKGGRRNLVLLLGRPTAAWVYAAAGVLTPLSIVGAVILGHLPLPALLGALPSLFLVKPLLWAFGDTSEPVPLPALGANVAWNLGTNAMLAVGLAAAVLLD
jgi:1,4-dihydroxy-2-naphthoate octaprenyltransferase